MQQKSVNELWDVLKCTLHYASLMSSSALQCAKLNVLMWGLTHMCAILNTKVLKTHIHSQSLTH